MHNCWICNLSGQTSEPPLASSIICQCDRCGRYCITLEATGAVPHLDEKYRALLSSHVYDENALGAIPYIRYEDIQQLKSLRPFSFIEKAKRLLLYLADGSDRFGALVDTGDRKIEALLQTFNYDDVGFVADYLAKQGWTDGPVGSQVEITPKGWIQVDAWRDISPSASRQGFVAMWFDKSLESAWTDGLEPAIRLTGYIPQRIDLKQHNNKICDEIIAEIRRSRFVVADFTGHRGGVYYEAGFASGMGLPVIYTCRKDDLPNLHFDVRQYNCIDWEDPSNLSDRLKARISATLGDGPNKNPPA